MWILGTDVRNGQRLAFSQFGVIVTFDISEYKSRVQTQLEQAKARRAALVETVRATIRMRLLDQHEESGSLPSTYEIEEEVRQAIESVDAHIDDKLGRLRTEARRLNSVEALVIVGEDTIWPLRATRLATSWSDVQAYTRSGEPEGPPDELPDPDNVRDPSEP